MASTVSYAEPLASIALRAKGYTVVLDNSTDLSLFPDSLQIEVNFVCEHLGRLFAMS
ncbi:MAG: hypothetical protein J0L73_06790 [Verrucomicrobia bacterium]|nr:hypothetical protein [Verrucomicrobiota bacterium]